MSIQAEGIQGTSTSSVIWACWNFRTNLLRVRRAPVTHERLCASLAGRRAPLADGNATAPPSREDSDCDREPSSRVGDLPPDHMRSHAGRLEGMVRGLESALRRSEADVFTTFAPGPLPMLEEIEDEGA